MLDTRRSGKGTLPLYFKPSNKLITCSSRGREPDQLSGSFVGKKLVAID
jgi:hypothetical protein